MALRVFRSRHDHNLYCVVDERGQQVQFRATRRQFKQVMHEVRKREVARAENAA